MWFFFAILTAILWGMADLFYKKGSDPKDPYSHFKIVIMVGLIMGIHATGYMLLKGLSFSWSDAIQYLPVSAMYILSMTLGYIGLRYIALSIASPVQNSSGAITTILLAIFFTQTLMSIEIFSIILILSGVILLAILEKKYEDQERIQKQIQIDNKYKKSFLAIFFPISYAIFDGLGTFLDGVYLDEMELISEDMALLSYEYTFLFCALIIWGILKIKKVPFHPLKEGTRTAAGLFETAGQYFYVFAMSANAIIAAPIIATYSIFSVLLARMFLKEKLTKAQYIVVLAVLIGIALLGIADEL